MSLSPTILARSSTWEIVVSPPWNGNIVPTWRSVSIHKTWTVCWSGKQPRMGRTHKRGRNWRLFSKRRQLKMIIWCYIFFNLLFEDMNVLEEIKEFFAVKRFASPNSPASTACPWTSRNGSSKQKTALRVSTKFLNHQYYFQKTKIIDIC